MLDHFMSWIRKNLSSVTFFCAKAEVDTCKLLYTLGLKKLVVQWCELDEVENECTSHNFSIFAIFLPKIIKIGGNLTKVWQEQISIVFWDTLYIASFYMHKASHVRQGLTEITQ